MRIDPEDGEYVVEADIREYWIEGYRNWDILVTLYWDKIQKII